MKVALIDNTYQLPRALDQLLVESEITLISFENTSSALEALSNTHFDCICASINADDEEMGMQLAEKLRHIKQSAHTPLLLLTETNIEHFYAKALAAGITEVFLKQELKELVNFLVHLSEQQKPINGHVLYIEDMKSQQQYVTEIFHKNGLRVDAFSNAEEAWDAYLTDSYDLVVTDIILEGKMTGMALTNRIRRLGGDKGDVPILAVTGYDDVARRIELFHLGVSDYVIKPIIEEEIMARVRQLIKGHRYFLEAKQQRKRAEQTSEAKSTFIAHMNHEFRVPLNSVLGFTELLLSDPSSNLEADQKENLLEIQNAGHILGELINDVTNLSKIEAGIIDINLSPVFLHSAIEQTVHHLSAFASKHNVSFLPYNISNDIAVTADPVRFNQVMINIISNAIKYNNPNGTIQIVFKETDDAYIRIGVKDTGIGIEQKDLGLLFQPFSRIGNHQNIEGTGLGLVITKHLVELMSGQIGCRPNPDQGVTFWIDLPKSTG